MDYLIAIFACLLVFLYYWKASKSRNLPPGPWGLPFVGYLPFLSKKPYLDFKQLAKKYGNVFSIRLGSRYIVVVNDFKSTKEAFAKDVYIGRPPDFSFPLNEETKKCGAVLGPKWKEQRRISLHMLRDLGFGKSKMEDNIQEEITDLLNHFEEKSGKPFAVRDLLSSSMSNNIGALVFGRRFKYDDPIRHMLNKSVNDVSQAAGQTAWTLFFPWLKKVAEVFGILNVGDVNEIAKEGRAFTMNEIEEHEKSLNPGNVRDFIDGYLLEIQKRKGEPEFNKYVLQDIVGAFFGAGSETVRSVVEWLILLVAQNQDHQRKIQAEIDDIIGRNRLSIWPDIKDMPYTNAFIMEMQRWITLVPLNLLRYTLADTELDGYFIPKHTYVLSNLWTVHHDTEYWGEDADEFRPERFLTEDGTAVKKFERLIPFSIGKRACPGEPLANIEAFLYFTAILQKFDITFPIGKEANFDGELGIALRPKIQDVVMTKRR